MASTEESSCCFRELAGPQTVLRGSSQIARGGPGSCYGVLLPHSNMIGFCIPFAVAPHFSPASIVS